MDWGKLLFSADGRIGRQSFWIGFLILLGVGVVLGWIPILGAVALIALIYPWICLFSKRFHDMGRSGWLAILPVVIPSVLATIGLVSAIGGVIGAGVTEDADVAANPGFWAAVGAGLIFFALSFIVWLGGTLWAGLTDGDPGPNRYGERPTLPSAGVGAPSHTPSA